MMAMPVAASAVPAAVSTLNKGRRRMVTRSVAKLIGKFAKS
jgi:hypothetical protein